MPIVCSVDVSSFHDLGVYCGMLGIDGIREYLLVILKYKGGQRWSLIRCTLGVENEDKNRLNFQSRVFNK